MSFTGRMIVPRAADPIRTTRFSGRLLASGNACLRYLSVDSRLAVICVRWPSVGLIFSRKASKAWAVVRAMSLVRLVELCATLDLVLGSFPGLGRRDHCFAVELLESIDETLERGTSVLDRH